MKNYRFRYLLRTSIDRSVIGSGTSVIEAATAREAVEKAIAWALTDTNADARLDPWVELTELAEVDADNCGRCWECLTNHNFMIVCVDCGNKRCPKATDHRNTCTHSNDLGQEGSIYAEGTGTASAQRLVEFFGVNDE